jgi:hypothetical protein
VKEKYPIFFISVPDRKKSSTKSSSVVVLPVPGGPSIIVFIRTASPDISLGLSLVLFFSSLLSL